MKLTDNDSEEETAVEEKKKAKLDLRNFVRTPEVDKEKEIESEAGESSGEETELKIRSRNRILHSSEDEETEEKIVIKTAVQTTSNEVKQASTTVISSGGNVSQTIIPPISSSIAVTSVAPIIPQVPTATPVDPLAALHSMVPNGSNVNTTLQPSLPSRGIPAPVIVGPERSGFLPYTHLYQPQPTGYYGNFPPPPANLYQPANFACPPHSPFTSARTPYIMGPSGYPTVGPNVFLPPPQSQPPQFHPQMAYGEKFQSSQPTQFVQENEGNSSRANAEGTLTDILSCAIRDSE